MTAHVRENTGRRPEPRIVDPATHPRSYVGLAVAAQFLGVNERTVRARVESGELAGWRDGKCYRIPVASLVALRTAGRYSTP